MGLGRRRNVISRESVLDQRTIRQGVGPWTGTVRELLEIVIRTASETY